ncbi:hypothetical protein QAD02_022535 [Eretmocerus hayati]|uniref:Uncharacterized protein n=1 Tax=Eretmocerus hayati TaxID=131215 RepID=A0ACC2PVD0_9HYME|nr:hypothetical protein QAD02_022535 [Eretmocerus hayati]
MSIKPLSKETIKLINSTQVISSIYSAVKELVENSLDAGAQNIEVNLVDNGLSLIEVKDNGIGISKEDAQFMALPAYTSKISDFSDLDLLSTYGFRGEGLTAVCQVSDVTVSTKTANDETMTIYTLDNEGHIVSSELSHGLTGTTVQMKNLFKHMPVRRNILNNKKRISQEIKAVELLLKNYAICKPSVRIMYRVNSNIVFTKPSCKTIKEAIKSVLGLQIFSKLFQMENTSTETKMQLFIPKKEIKDCTEVSQTGLQFLCVNDRPIKSKEIEKIVNKRISEYFNPESSHSRKYVFCLILTVNPTMLDVNLEPNKDKVFLQNEAAITDEINRFLLDFYQLQDSQMSTQSDVENEDCNRIAKSMEKDKDENNIAQPLKKKRKAEPLTETNKKSTGENESSTSAKKDAEPTDMDIDFLQVINNPRLSDSESNDEKEFEPGERSNKKRSEQPQVMKVSQTSSEDSDIFEYATSLPIKVPIIEETLSQLPKVDLGEDFALDEILNKGNKASIPEVETTDSPDQQDPEIAWSKGHVPGLQGGIALGCLDGSNEMHVDQLKEDEEFQQDSELFDYRKVETVDDETKTTVDGDGSIAVPDEFDWDVTVKNSRKRTPTKTNTNRTGSSRQSNKFSAANNDPTQTKIPFAGDNACLSFMGPSAFAMYCATARSKIVKEHPELSPAEVALYLNREWKEISPEERDYYRDLANQHSQTSSSSQKSQKPKSQSKSQPSSTEKEQNRKQLVNMLENMKMNKSEAKNKSMIMRTSTTWEISIPSVEKKFREAIRTEERLIIGALNSLLWIIKLNSNLFIFDVSEVCNGLDSQDYIGEQINKDQVENIVDQWFEERNDMSIFRPLYSLPDQD